MSANDFKGYFAGTLTGLIIFLPIQLYAHCPWRAALIFDAITFSVSWMIILIVILFVNSTAQNK